MKNDARKLIATRLLLAITLLLGAFAPKRDALAGSLIAAITDRDGAALADAVIYALPVAGTNVPQRPARTFAIEQVNREFVPFVTAVQTGTTINFPNRDALLHHVYSFSPAKQFEIKLYSGEAPRGVLFDKPGTVTLGCNIHDWMIAYIHVVDTPYFAKSDAAGRAGIPDIVAGEFEAHVWHPRQRVTAPSKPVKLDAKGTTEVAFSIDVSPRKTKFKPPANPIQYR